MVSGVTASEPGMASRGLFERAVRLMPGGVNSPVRAFRAVGGTPRFIDRASGCTLIDADGNRLIDYVGSWGAMIAGHAHPSVVGAVERTLRDGLSFGAPTRIESEMAEQIIARVPSADRVRMVSSGTEAVMSAVRLARAATGRQVVVKFEGCYHGHSDALLSKAGSGLATLGLPGSPGVTPDAARHTIVLPFGDAGVVADAFAEHPDDVAAVLVEPVPGNMGVVVPPPEYLRLLREITQRHGALLIFDEVMTGFRVARGGAQERFGVTPDLTALGKVIGGGLPVGAYAGPARLMDLIAPAGPVYQAGTLSGNPVAMAAGLATLALLDDAAYDRLELSSADLERGIRHCLAESGIRAAFSRVGSMMSLFLGVEGVGDFDGAGRADHEAFSRFFHGMLRQGVHLPPSGFEAWFVSLSHDAGVIERTISSVGEALAEANIMRSGSFPIGVGEIEVDSRRRREHP